VFTAQAHVYEKYRSTNIPQASVAITQRETCIRVSCVSEDSKYPRSA
jgi:hypothetical protein